ncbi:MAG: hypothetical protein AAF558_00925 [Verrucomicrobiota bacterium]
MALLVTVTDALDQPPYFSASEASYDLSCEEEMQCCSHQPDSDCLECPCNLSTSPTLQPLVYFKAFVDLPLLQYDDLHFFDATDSLVGIDLAPSVPPPKF